MSQHEPLGQLLAPLGQLLGLIWAARGSPGRLFLNGLDLFCLPSCANTGFSEDRAPVQAGARFLRSWGVQNQTEIVPKSLLAASWRLFAFF